MANNTYSASTIKQRPDNVLTIPFGRIQDTGRSAAHPWDPPFPLPKKGNGNRLRIFAAVGSTLTQWEELELRYSLLNLRLLGLEYHSDGKAALKIYEQAVGPAGRLDLVSKAAEGYFVKICDQALEADLGALIEETRRYSLRRNDIAHGSVRELTLDGEVSHRETGRKFSLKTSLGFFLVPISSIGRRLGPDSSKKFCGYTSNEINKYGNFIMKLRFRLEDFMEKMPLIEDVDAKTAHSNILWKSEERHPRTWLIRQVGEFPL